MLPRLIAALASGLVLAIISPPLNIHWLHWFMFLPLFWALREDDGPANVALAWLTGYAAVNGCFFWLTDTIVIFSNIPMALSLAIMHLFAFVFALPYPIVFGTVHPLRRRFGAAWIFLTPAVLVAVEFLGPALFPYYQGVTQYRAPWIWQLASVTGVTGVSYLILLTNCAMAELIFRRREGRGAPWGVVGAVAGIWLTNLAFGYQRSASVAEEVAGWPTLKMTQLQQAATMEEVMAGSARDATVSWVKLSSQLVGQEIDLAVWPEGSTPYDPRQSRVMQLMANVTRNLQAPVVFGGGFATPTKDPYTGREYVEQRNSIYYMSEEGALLGRYDKMVPLPFGEYLPLADTFPFLKELIQGPGDFKAGDEAVYFEIDGKTFSTPVCYEAILGPFFRSHLADADLLINVTNDGWFGDTACPHQHAMLAAARAVELGRPMYRLAYTGVSFVVTPDGGIHHETEPYVEVARVIDVPVGRLETIYGRVGDVFPWLCVLLSGGALLAARSRGVTPPSAPS